MATDTNIKGILAFLLLAFGIAWLLWGLPILLGAPIKSAFFRSAVFLGTFAPAAACFIVRKWVTCEGFSDAGLALNFEKWRYYVLALIVPVAVVIGIVLIAPAVEAGRADTASAIASLVPSAFHARNTPLAWLLIVIGLGVISVVLTPILWGEEFGWRSYLQLRLFPRRPLLAAIATGLIWGVWHYPLLLVAPELPLHPKLILLLFPVGTVFYSIFFGWLRSASGSIWTSSLAHSAVDNLRSPLVIALFAAQADKLNMSLIGMALFGLVAVITIVSQASNPATASR